MTDLKFRAVVTDNGRILHLFEDCVAVAWNTREQKEKSVVDGKTITKTWREPTGLPYIDFVSVRNWNDDEEERIWEDEDSPVEGGMSLSYAKHIYRVLGIAIEYLEKLKDDRR